MIELIIGLFSGIKNLLYYGLLLSYEIGKFLIKLVQISWFILRYIYDVFQTLMTVICEDFVIFLHDVFEYIACVLDFITNTCGLTYNIIQNGIEYFKYYVSLGKEIISTCSNSIISGHLKLFMTIGQLLIGIKQLFILLGSGIWFLLTLIPISIIYSFSLCTYYVGSCIEELVNVICMLFKPIIKFAQDLIDFTFDVPFEATIGLIAGGCIVYLLAKFHMMAYGFLKEQFLLLMRYMRVTVRNNLHPRQYNQVQRTTTYISPNRSASRNNSDIYCVICQEREKCILILPCKHVCLCGECKDQLYQYHSRCPVCRSYVNKTMKVFV